MDEAGAMGLRQAVRELRPEVEDLRNGQRPAREPAAQRLALDVLHHDVVRALLAGRLADVVDVDDVRMVEGGGGARLPVEAVEELGIGPGAQHLQGHRASEPGVAGAIHLAHAARAETVDHLVGGDAGAGDEGVLGHPGPHATMAFHQPRGPSWSLHELRARGFRMLIRVEYLDFQSLPDHREYRLAVYGADGTAECRLRIANAAFAAARVSMQDGPDVCYQRLRRTVSAGEAMSPGVVTIDEAELVRYREAHTPAPRRRAAAPPRAARPAFVPRPPFRAPVPPPVAAAAAAPKPRFGEGQRVNHATYGNGVTLSSDGGHTVVRFDEDGPKTFVTSMLRLELLSPPHTWETTARGKNRPRRLA